MHSVLNPERQATDSGCRHEGATRGGHGLRPWGSARTARGGRDRGARLLPALTRLVNQALERALPHPTGSLQLVREAMRYSVFPGGKRFRPLLALGACEAVGASVRCAIPAACAVELIHCYSLVHDDLPSMDDADARRGKPSCHRRFGEGHAILAGDALLTLAFELLSQNGLPNSLAVIRAVSRACGTTGLIGGQVMDLRAAERTAMRTGPILTDIARRKTAALMAAAVAAGALAGSAAPQALRRLERYGRKIGLAFQLLDDLQDGEGLAQALGPREALARAQRLIHDAGGELEPFGSRADVLRELAAWLERSSAGPSERP